jgi:hypothetical protein
MLNAQSAFGRGGLIVLKNCGRHLHAVNGFGHSQAAVSMHFALFYICFFQQRLHEKTNLLVRGFNTSMMIITDFLAGWRPVGINPIHARNQNKANAFKFRNGSVKPLMITKGDQVTTVLQGAKAL